MLPSFSLDSLGQTSTQYEIIILLLILLLIIFKKNQSIFNQIPRNGGSFFNMQANTYVNHTGVSFIKIAMFDEVDEGIQSINYNYY